MLKEVRKPSLTIFVKNVINSAHSKTSQQTFVLMKTSFVFVLRRRLDQDEYVRLRLTSSEDVFKTSWSRPIYSSWPYVFKTSSRRFQDVFKTPCKNVSKTSSRPFEGVFKTSCKDIFKTFSRRVIKLNCSC